jgi:C-terminal processing protease CtpA/Prc
LAKSLIYDEAFAYLRIGRMDADLGAAVRKAWQDLSATNKLKGVVLDVRYADGHDYVAAAAVADLFLENERVLLDLGEGAIKSKTKNDAITLPVMILVNGQTAGAAEALAAVLRETKTGLLLGAKTAGQAAVAREFKLKTGQVLRIATAPVKLGNSQALTPEGVKPDIEVQVSAEDEWAYFQDAYAVLQRDPDPAAGAGASSGTVVAGLSTNRPSRSRINEAELVRMRKGESDPDEVAPSRRSRAAEGDKPQVRDPVLVRALDLLKALAVVRRGQTK